MKYILVSGGVISGIGKGVISSSVGTILKSYGLRVTAIKIDPYLNIDAGTFSPYEHGEVFVLDDGGEVDLDLGNYERFLNVTLHKDNNITTVVPHVTDAIMEWVSNVSKIPVDGDDQEPEVCIIELGGTIGDIEGMPFIEAFRQFQFRVKRENFCNIHVSLIPQPSSTGEQKTKPTQHSVRALRGLGLSPDLIVCRSQSPILDDVREKISNFCHVDPDQVIAVPDVSSIYHVPSVLEEHNISSYFFKRLGLPNRSRKSTLSQWQNLARKYDRITSHCNIALVGKYTQLEDSYASVIKALRHAAHAVNKKLKLTIIEAEHLEENSKSSSPIQYHEAWKKLCMSDGLLVPGGFGSRGVEGKITAVNWARTHKRPFLGVCLGLQVAAIEFARNVLNMQGANSTEFDATTVYPVVIDMPEHNTGMMGGTMRLGKRKTIFKTEDSVLRKLYNIDGNSVDERHRHRYEVNPEYTHLFEEKGFIFVGHDTEAMRMEVIELKDHPYFVGVQFHPEFKSRPLHASAPYLGLMLASCGKLQTYLERGNRLSPRDRGFFSEDELISESDDGNLSQTNGHLIDSS